MRTFPTLPVVLRYASLAIALSVSIPVHAQPGTTRLFVQSSLVKPDMLTEWMDLQKNEVVPALKKAGVKTRRVLRTVLGNRSEYLSITPLESYGNFDGPSPLVKALGPEASARLIARLNKCVTASRYYVINRVDEMSSIPETPAPVSVTTRLRIAPGRLQDYEALVRGDILPLSKKAKAEGKILGYGYTRRGLGATGANEVTVTTYLAKFAEIDKGPYIIQLLGQEGARKLAAKFVGLSTNVDTVVRGRVADLSY